MHKDNSEATFDDQATQQPARPVSAPAESDESEQKKLSEMGKIKANKGWLPVWVKKIVSSAFESDKFVFD
jgi:hypothetical protein